MFEPLERRTMCSITLVNGVLTLTGTAGKDTMDVIFDGLMYGADDGQVMQTQYYDPDDVAKIEMYGLGGNDTLRLDATVSDPANLFGGDGDDRLTGALRNDYLSGGPGNDVLTGNAGNDKLIGGDGNDAMLGGANNDTLDGGAGSDSFSGADGLDVADYTARNSPLVITIDNVPNDGDPGGEMDNVNDSVEAVWGGSGNDHITGSSAANRLEGRGGNDSLYGGSGADLLYGGAGDDYLNGGDDGVVDQLWGEAGNDTFVKNTMDFLADRTATETIIP
jgi:Ca2+-binding RTX toxin-like protein